MSDRARYITSKHRSGYGSGWFQGDEVGAVHRGLEAEITWVAAHLAAGECRWLELVAEFDRREAWASWGNGYGWGAPDGGVAQGGRRLLGG